MKQKTVRLVIRAVLLCLFGVAVGVGLYVGRRMVSSQSADGYRPRPAGTLTFNKDVAPIVFEHCAMCHRPGESGPFTLLSYEDVKSRAAQIVEVTETRFMPPWLPAPGYGEFVGERRLSSDQIDIIRQWKEQGAMKGNPSDLPAVPQWIDGWQLGQPDLVISLPQPYTLPASGTDVFRNFVLPIPVSTTRFVKAVELRPGNKRIVHHAIMMTDRTRMTRQLDQQDPGPGFAGMNMGYAKFPDGHYLGWTPGKMADAHGTDTSWRLHPGTDLVLQLHMLPSGKAELIEPTVGIFFDANPRPGPKTTMLTLRADEDLDIPPGVKDFEVADSIVLPVDVQVALVYPHAHYLGKQIQGFATRPDGTTAWLIRIEDWDFNWQDSYRYSAPLELPKGTVVTMRWTYDNSSDNARNPNRPPKRVVQGNKSTDEMAHLYLQLLVHSDRDANLLRVAELRHWLQKVPGDWPSHTLLGIALESLGELEEAIGHFRRALELRPDHAPAHTHWGFVLESQKKIDEAIYHYRQTIRLKPDESGVHAKLAAALQVQGLFDEAMEHWRLAVRFRPDHAGVRTKLAERLQARGLFSEAIEHWCHVVEREPDDVGAYYSRALAYQQAGRDDLAWADFTRVIELKPDRVEGYSNRGIVGARLGNYEQALADFAKAIDLKPRAPQSYNNLAWLLATCPDAKFRDAVKAVSYARQACELTKYDNVSMLATLAAAYAKSGEFTEAVKWQTKAHELAPASAKADMSSRLELYRAGKPRQPNATK